MRLSIKIYLKTIFLILNINSFAQTFSQEFLYTYTSKVDINSPMSKTSTTILRVGENESYFSDYLQFKIQEIKNNPDFDAQHKIDKIKGLDLPTFNFYIIKQKDKLHLIQNFDNKEIGYSESLIPSNNWEILNESEKILDYTCTKATLNFGGRKWLACFTPEIPISDGPYKFSGLPGLILKINDIENEHIFEISGIKNINEPISIERF